MGGGKKNLNKFRRFCFFVSNCLDLSRDHFLFLVVSILEREQERKRVGLGLELPLPGSEQRGLTRAPRPSSAEKPGTAMCVGCGSQIHDQFILRVSPDLEWHAACLKCAECSQYLDETCTCFVRDGKTYCKRDYVR